MPEATIRRQAGLAVDPRLRTEDGRHHFGDLAAGDGFPAAGRPSEGKSDGENRCLRRPFRQVISNENQCENSAIKMMMGKGIPSSQRRIERMSVSGG
jgi:hypothetical protein